MPNEFYFLVAVDCQYDEPMSWKDMTLEQQGWEPPDPKLVAKDLMDNIQTSLLSSEKSSDARLKGMFPKAVSVTQVAFPPSGPFSIGGIQGMPKKP